MSKLSYPTKTGFSQPYSEVSTITPDLAQSLLKKNTNNRKVKRANVNFLKSQLLQNKWMLNGESIKIAPNGEILDGQHRLIACAESGCSIQCLITYNVDPNSKHTMDTGRNRSAVDVLSFAINGKYVGHISSASKFILGFEKQRYGVASRGNGNKVENPDNTDILNFVLNTKSFQEFVEHSAKIHANGDRCVNPRTFIGLHWIIAQKAGDDYADRFFAALSTGIGLTSNNPIYVIRKKLISMKMNRYGIDKLTNSQVLWAIVKAWNYWLKGDTATKFKYDTRPIEISIPK